MASSGDGSGGVNEPHHKIKLTILKNYFNAWLPIMNSRNTDILYIDTFAGPGKYGEEEGSPAVKKNKKLYKTLKLFLESSEKELHEKLPHTELTVKCFRDSFENSFPTILDPLLQQQGLKDNMAVLAFIDPFGYTLPFEFVKRALEFNHGEVLINFMCRDVNRFINVANRQAVISELFGSDEWIETVQSPEDWKKMTPKDRQHFLINFYCGQLKSAGANYTFTFNIRGKSNILVYSLVFATRHRRGLQVMKDTMWKLQFQGKGDERYVFSDFYAAFQDDNLVTHGPGLNDDDLKQVTAQVYMKFQGENVSLDAVEDFVLMETDFPFKKKILEELARNNSIACITTNDGNLKRARVLLFPNDCMIEFVSSEQLLSLPSMISLILAQFEGRKVSIDDIVQWVKFRTRFGWDPNYQGTKLTTEIKRNLKQLQDDKLITIDKKNDIYTFI